MASYPHHLKSELLSGIPGIEHGFGTRSEPLPALFDGFIERNWNQLRPQWKQNHGINLAHVISPAQACGEVDALESSAPEIPIAVMTADCVPILMARVDGKRIAAIHAGWRGTQAGILDHLCSKLRSEGEDLAQWVAAIGPSIGPCCYEVSPELAESFSQHFPHQVSGRHLNLPAMNRDQLLKQGIAEVDLIQACTKCSVRPEVPVNLPDHFRYFSYRREGSGTREWSVICIRG
jgi:polyphenol oxidase